MPEEMNNLFVSGLAGQLVDVVTTVNENTLLTENLAEAG
jgi:hypothetical protein